MRLFPYLVVILLSVTAVSAERVYYQSFETGDAHAWKDEFRPGGWDLVDSDPANDLVARVNNRAHTGSWSIQMVVRKALSIMIISMVNSITSLMMLMERVPFSRE